jgi:archaellum biogenesis protein FlaJ (TadC family)
VSITVIESTLLAALEISLIAAFTRLVPVMGSAPARAGGAGPLGFVMFLMVVGFAIAGLRLYQNIQMIRRLNVETFNLEERLGDDEEDE